MTPTLPASASLTRPTSTRPGTALVDGTPCGAGGTRRPLRAAVGLDVSVVGLLGLPAVRRATPRKHRPSAPICWSPTRRVTRVSGGSPRHADWQLIRHSPCPVLLSRSDGREGATANILVAVDPMHAHDRPAALDDALISPALGAGRSSRRAHQPPALLPAAGIRPIPRAGRGQVGRLPPARKLARSAPRCALRQLAQASRHPGVGCRSSSRATPGRPSRTRPSGSGADLVVMGAVARSRLQALADRQHRGIRAGSAGLRRAGREDARAAWRRPAADTAGGTSSWSTGRRDLKNRGRPH